MVNSPASHLASIIPINALREGKMPRATVSRETERKELKTAPGDGNEEGGFVELRRMTYGEFLSRRDMISKMSFDGQGKDTKATMEMAQALVTQFEFKTCIVDHNLTDDNDKPIDFRSAKALAILDPRVGEEISHYIDEMNKWEPEEEGADPLPDSRD